MLRLKGGLTEHTGLAKCEHRAAHDLKHPKAAKLGLRRPFSQGVYIRLSEACHGGVRWPTAVTDTGGRRHRQSGGGTHKTALAHAWRLEAR